MSYYRDIKEWALTNKRSPDKVEGILLRSGWDPKKYQSTMKNQLFYWLDQWYTLSVKSLPKPATSARKNPIEDHLEKKFKILWVGPGMGDNHIYLWQRVFLQLDQDGFQFDYIKLLDIKDTPSPFFGEKWLQERGATEVDAKGNFFDETDQYNVIIIDFIEAWLMGHLWWEFDETPFAAILERWRKKILTMQPYQVWVRQDNDSESTINPNLFPEYKIVAKTGWGFYELSPEAEYWSNESIKVATPNFIVWQKIN